MKDTRTRNKNRHNLDIVREVLSIALAKVRKTKIMYGANLSFIQLEKYLSLLMGSGLLKHDSDSGYLTTGTGMEFLSLYENYIKRSTRLMEEVERNTRDRLLLESMCFGNKNETNQTEIRKDNLK